MAIIAFALGVWICQQLAALPEVWLQGLALLLLTAGAALAFRLRDAPMRPSVRVLVLAVALFSGFLWAAWRADVRLGDALAESAEGQEITVTGVVAELPQSSERGVRFAFDVEQASQPVPSRIQLTWNAARDGSAPRVRPGERWKLLVRLQRPHGAANPGGFDFEAWLLERRLRATGTVRPGASNRRLDDFVPAPMNAVHRARDALRARFLHALEGAEYAGVLVALAVGDQRAITAEQWKVFRATGVAHLISISGLHVSLVALMAGGTAGWAWRRFPRLMLRVPARKAAALVGLSCAGVYALLAGFGVPTQRAFIMLAVAAGALLMGRESQGSRVLALALFAVLLFDPWAVLSAGFWLSFGAVAVILYLAAGRVGASSGWRAAVRLQLAITLATVPPLLLLFSGFSLISPVANAFAIPLVSFIVTPLALLAIVLPLDGLLDLGHVVTAAMMLGLEGLAGLSFAMWQQATPPIPVALAAVAGIAWCLLPRGTPARHAGAMAVLPMLLWSAPRPLPGAFELTVLDVGQGTAVHVRTASHDLLYDTGPRYGSGSDAGERVVLPYLVSAGTRRLHRVVLSHGDSDHTGGAGSIAGGMRVWEAWSPAGSAEFMSGVPGQACTAGAEWTWDDVRFAFLHPAEDDHFADDNNASCVLRVQAGPHSVLLAGDVEARGERALVRRDASAIASSVVVVPHHGSKSSSSEAFIDAVQAREAVFSAGWRNQFRHPHQTVVERWQVAGARTWRTDAQGAIRVEAGPGGLSISAEREQRRRYWHGR